MTENNSIILLEIYYHTVFVNIKCKVKIGEK